MCLDVAKSHVRNPIPEMECYKILRYIGNGRWETPYQDCHVPIDTGWFMPSEPAKREACEYHKDESIERGYIHALTRADKGLGGLGVDNNVYDKLPAKPTRSKCYRFRAIARDVVAEGYNWRADIACKALYIPAFDKTGKHRNAILDMTVDIKSK